MIDYKEKWIASIQKINELESELKDIYKEIANGKEGMPGAQGIVRRAR